MGWQFSRSARTRGNRRRQSSTTTCPAGGRPFNRIWPACPGSCGSSARDHDLMIVPNVVIPRPTPIFPIGLIALDLDGTLIGDDLVLRPRTVAAIRAARERGVAVSIVTGRMTTSALPF